MLAGFPAVAICLVCSAAIQLACTSAASLPLEASRPFVIHDVTVIDIARGEGRPHRTVIVEGGRIRAVQAAGGEMPSDAVLVDGKGGYLIPGLWDMHVHTLWDARLRDVFPPLFIAHGVTGVRDMGGDLALRERWQAEIMAGSLAGLRVVAAGPILDGIMVDPRITVLVEDAARARIVVDSLARAGADLIKVYAQLPRPAYDAVAARTRQIDLPFAGHVPPDVEVAEAAAMGQASIEHLDPLVQVACPGDADCGAVVAAFSRHGTRWVPTISVFRNKLLSRDSTLLLDPRLSRMPAFVAAEWAIPWCPRRERPPAYFEEVEAQLRNGMRRVREMRAAGVPILAGTDAGAYFTYPGSTLHDELELLVEAGLTPAQALETATIEPARFLGATDSLGTIAPGMAADLVLLDGDPRRDITNVRRIRAVVAGGRLYDRAALDGLTAAATEAARRIGIGITFCEDDEGIENTGRGAPPRTHRLRDGDPRHER